MDFLEFLIRKSEEIVKQYEISFGVDHPNVAEALLDVANNCRIRDQEDKAIPFLIRALKIYEKKFGKGHISTIKVLDELGECFAQTGSFEEAESMFVKSLKIKKDRTINTDIANTLYNLGRLYRKTKKYNRAENNLFEALKIYEKECDFNNLVFVHTLDEIEKLFSEMSKSDASKSVLKRVFTVLKQAFQMLENITNSNQPLIFRKIGLKLAIFYANHNMFNEAQDVCKKIINSNPECIHTLADIGSFYQRYSYYDESEELFKRALEVEKETYLLFMLSTLYIDSKRFDEAEKSLIETIRAIDNDSKYSKSKKDELKEISMDYLNLVYSHTKENKE